jgi:hypothetical protein
LKGSSSHTGSVNTKEQRNVVISGFGGQPSTCWLSSKTFAMKTTSRFAGGHIGEGFQIDSSIAGLVLHVSARYVRPPHSRSLTDHGTIFNTLFDGAVDHHHH